MTKTRLGVSTKVLGAAALLMFCFGGYFPGLVLAGYILLFEGDLDLRGTALMAAGLQLGFSLLSYVIGFLPDLLRIIESFLDILEVYVNWYMIDRLESLMISICNVARYVVLILLAGACLIGKPVLPGFIKKLAE